MPVIYWGGAIDKTKYANDKQYQLDISALIKKGRCFIVLPDGYFLANEIITSNIDCLISDLNFKQQWVRIPTKPGLYRITPN